MDDEEALRIQQHCQQRANALIRDSLPKNTPPAPVSQSHQNRILEQLHAKRNEANQSQSAVNPGQTVSSVIHQEIIAFQAVNVDPCITPFNVLDWWKIHATEFPHLARIARRKLCQPASSATSERSFSAANLIVTPLRNRLTEQHAHTITKIAINSKLSP